MSPLRFLDNASCASILAQWITLVDQLEEAVKSFASGSSIQPVRASLNVDGLGDGGRGRAMVMPCANDKHLCSKLLYSLPSNAALGLPTLSVFVTTFNGETGDLQVVMVNRTCTVYIMPIHFQYFQNFLKNDEVILIQVLFLCHLYEYE